VNHSLISASGNTHAKIAGLAIAASLVFVVIVAAAGAPKPDAGARTYGPVVKATTATSIAKTGGALVR
jgi:hypothetical protein